jgi:hypothetical protein
MALVVTLLLCTGESGDCAYDSDSSSGDVHRFYFLMLPKRPKVVSGTLSLRALSVSLSLSLWLPAAVPELG